MPLSVRYLHLRGHPQTLRAGSENIAHSNDAVGLLRVPVKVFVRYRTPAQTDFLHPGCVTVADTDHRNSGTNCLSISSPINTGLVRNPT